MVFMHDSYEQFDNVDCDCRLDKLRGQFTDFFQNAFKNFRFTFFAFY